MVNAKGTCVKIPINEMKDSPQKVRHFEPSKDARPSWVRVFHISSRSSKGKAPISGCANLSRAKERCPENLHPEKNLVHLPSAKSDLVDYCAFVSPTMTLSLFEPLPILASASPTQTPVAPLLEKVRFEDEQLAVHFCSQLRVNESLSRQVVSFQASKNVPGYRWFKFKEAFSASLVRSLLGNQRPGRLLDPFAGSGTSLFAASELGWKSEGIEVLPIGREIISIRSLIENQFVADDFDRLHFWAREKPWKTCQLREKFEIMPITNGAYSFETHEQIEAFLGCSLGENQNVRRALKLALLCVLESVSYTRKDGQYLRWDYRSNRKQGVKPFNKGRIWSFEEAIEAKLHEILSDSHPAVLDVAPEKKLAFTPGIHSGSCLEILPTMPDSSFDAIVTSPPYCNRYDYTRTYALELALLGVSASEIVALRQQMLSCTVENRAKDLLHLNPTWQRALEVAAHCDLLTAICNYLDAQKAAGLLNNAGIARMVRGYFLEMACVIQECGRVLKPGAKLCMVNDNVRYCGASISADFILSHFAQNLGFEVEQIGVLPGNKGNSSQQMGAHGRDALRKCVYIWKKL